MTLRPKVRNAALVGALTAVTLSAWATHESYNSTYVPYYQPAPHVMIDPATPAEPVLLEDTLAPNETVIAIETPAPVIERSYVVERAYVPQPGMTIEERRLSEDERIQLVVMDRLASNPRISGKIGVESRDAVVTLTGYTRTVGQAWHAERDARSVAGVRYVQNQIRPRVGGSV